MIRLFFAFVFLGAATPAAAQLNFNPAERLDEIERRTGGRLGLALIDAERGQVMVHRADERFAMCSTFKLPLAAMVLSRGPSQRTPLPIRRQDLLSHSPWSQQVVARRAEGRVGLAAQAIVEHSDNAAANVLLRQVGGPAGFTSWLRSIGDRATRLDRYELQLNENVRGDPRDTTTPAAFSHTAGRIVYGNILQPALRDQVRRWTIASRTGLRRIRAGLPAGWQAGDKTGTCGTAWNDTAWFESSAGRRYVLAVFLDRPTIPAAEAEAAIADVARLAVTVATNLERPPAR